MADIRCPMCGQSNPEGSQTCKFCQARLVAGSGDASAAPPTVRIPAQPQGRPQPAQPAPDDQDWLSALRGSTEGGEESAPNIFSNNKEGTSGAQAAAPDWLAGIQPAPAEEGLPAWLSGESLSSGDSAVPAGEVPEWLKNLGNLEGGQAPAAEAEGEDWMKQLGRDLTGEVPPVPSEPVTHAQEETAQPPVAESNGWMREPDAAGEGQAPDLVSKAEMPDWLQEAGETQAPTATSGDALRDWLSSLDETPTTPIILTSARGEAPDWLSGPSVASQEQAAPEEIPAAPTPAEEIPPWMSEAPAAPVPAEGIPAWMAEAPVEASAEAPAAPVPAEEIPAWMVEASAETPAGAMAAPTPAEEIQPWMAETPIEASAEMPAAPTPVEEIPAKVTQAPVEEPPAAAPEALPDWLSAAEVSATPASTEGLPAWMSTLPAEAAPQQTAEPQLPDWMKAIKPGPVATTPVESEKPAEQPAQAQPPPMTQALAWARFMDKDQQAQLPEWLSAEEATPAAKELGEDLDWLKAVGETPQPVGEAPVDWLSTPPMEQPVKNLEDIADWNKLAQPEPGELAGPGETVRIEPPAAGETTPSSISLTEPAPDWLAMIGESAAPAMPQPAEGMDIADWLRTVPVVEQTAAAESQEKPVEAAPAGEQIEMGEMPAWLQAMRPVEAVVPEDIQQPEDDQTIEKSGPLAGLRGVLRPEALAARYRKPPVYSAKLQVNEKQRLHVSLLEELINQEAQPVEMRKERGATPRKLTRLVLGLLLLASVLLPMLGGYQPPAPAIFATEVKAFYTHVENLPVNAPVLLAVDYEAGLAGEMRASVGGIVEHLMVKNVRLAVVSTVPAGPALAEQLLGLAQKRQTGYNLSTRAVNLSYLPGGIGSLQELALNPRKAAPLSLQSYETTDAPWDSAVLKGVDKISDFWLVIVLTDNAETARAWVEQVQPALGDKPLLMGVSAQAAPIVRPYTTGGQVRGLVSGLMGGRMYDGLRNQPTQNPIYSGAYQSALIYAVIVALLGLLLGAVTTLFSRRKA